MKFTSRRITWLYAGISCVMSSLVCSRARADEPIAAPSRNVSRNSAGMSASIAEKASEEAAVRSLFRLKEDTASDRTDKVLAGSS